MFEVCEVGDVGVGMWDVGYGMFACRMFGMCDIWDMECSGCGMFEMWEMWNVRCLKHGMWGWNLCWDVGC